MSTEARRRRWKSEPFVLFVEGYSDLTLYIEMMEHLGQHECCFIQDLGGKGRDKLHDEAKLLLKPDNLAQMEAVGVILDADESAAAAFNLAQAALRDAVGVNVERPAEWCLAANGKTRFGIFVVGGLDQQVEVESLAWAAWRSTPANEPLGRCVESFLQCASHAGLRLQSIDKVRIGAAMAVLNEDDPRLGPAARAGLFNFDAAEFAALREFLRGMTTPREAR